MKLIDRLDPQLRDETLDYFDHHNVDRRELNLIDNFLADLGFKLSRDRVSPHWMFKYDNEDAIMIWFNHTWRILFTTQVPNFMQTVEDFDSVDELIKYLSEV